jgi:hypothetical protein
MNKGDADKSANANDATVSPGSSGLEENADNRQARVAVNRFKKVTDKLYRCLALELACKHRFSFGAKNFCSWLLRSETGHSENNFPCVQEDKSPPRG